MAKKAQGKKSTKKSKPSVKGESFTEGMLTWSDPRIAGKRRSIDQALGKEMGGSAATGLRRSADVLRARSANPSNKQATRDKADRGLKNIELLQSRGGVEDRPTTVDAISQNYEKILKDNIARGAETGEGFPGLAWYFDQRRGHARAGNTPSQSDLTQRQLSAMAGVASSGKSPDDEIASVQGTVELIRKHGSRTINGMQISTIPSGQLGKLASQAATWNAYNEAPSSSSRPEAPPPQADPDVFTSLKNAGRAHEANVAKNVGIAKGEIPTTEAFDPSTTPKTAAYAEMQHQSNPDSDIEADYRSIGAHIRDVMQGTQSPNQGLLLFSQTSEDPKTRAYPLRTDAPTAIDTWMIAAGSGQPLKSYVGGVDPQTGKGKGRSFSPAKMLVDKDMPLSPTTPTKGSLGISGTTDVSVTPEALVSAQANEAIQRVSRRMGAMSFDQFGNDIHLPSSMVQEGVWTEARRQANSDPAYNKMVKQQAAEAKARKNEYIPADEDNPYDEFYEPLRILKEQPKFDPKKQKKLPGM